MTMKIKGAIFDMDGTLINSLIVWREIWQAISDRYLDGREDFPGEEIDLKLRTMTLREGMALIHNVFGIGRDGDEILKFCNEIIADFYRNRVEMKPGAIEFLKYLYDNDVKMCIASASSLDMVEIAARRCELGKYMPRLLSSCDFGCGKDKPDVYLAALEYLGTPVEETWVFEDSLVALKTAKGLGMPVVGIYDAYNFGHEEMEKISDCYIGDGEGLDKLIEIRTFE
jgi:HAD superfamily hydrolase (TIGR01509 family)